MPVENLTSGISKSVSHWDPDVLVSYNGPFRELSPVEVRPRSVPPLTQMALQPPEQNAFDLGNVDAQQFRTYLRANGLALVVMRNVTTRDRADRQQPCNLRVPGGTQTTASGGGLLYDIAHMQFFQGDQIRGAGGTASPTQGRRILAQVLHDKPATVANAANPGGPPGSFQLRVTVRSPCSCRRAAPWPGIRPARPVRRWCASVTGSPSSQGKSTLATGVTVSTRRTRRRHLRRPRRTLRLHCVPCFHAGATSRST